MHEHLAPSCFVIGDFLPMPYNYAVQVAVVIPCHIVGRIKAAGIKSVEDTPATPAVVAAPLEGEALPRLRSGP